MERSRRDRFATHTVPLTWEVPAIVTVGVLFLIASTPLVVQGLVAWLVAGTFAWPTHHLGTALTGLVHGRFGEGLAANLAGHLPRAALMWVLTVVGEVVVLGSALVAGLRMRDLVSGSNARHGLATSLQAAEALGLPRLRKSAPVIRPDLHVRRQLRRPLRLSSGRDERGNR
jgi:hypothetical protein